MRNLCFQFLANKIVSRYFVASIFWNNTSYSLWWHPYCPNCVLTKRKMWIDQMNFFLFLLHFVRLNESIWSTYNKTACGLTERMSENGRRSSWPNAALTKFSHHFGAFLSAAKGQRPKNYLSFCCWFSSWIFHLKNLCNLSLSLCIFIIFLSFCYCLSPYLSISLLYMSTYLPMSIYLHQHTYLSISRHLPTYDYLPTYVNLPTPTNLHQHT